MSNTGKMGNLYSVILCTWSISIVRRCETKTFVLLVIIYLAWTQFQGFFKKQIIKLTEERETYQKLERRKFCGRLINNFLQWGAL